MANDNDNSEFSRRELMKNTSALGLSAFGLGTIASGTAAAQDREFAVTDATRLATSAAREELANARSVHQVEDLIAGIERDAKLSANPESPFALSVETDDAELNRVDPTVVFMGLKREGGYVTGRAAGILVTVVIDTTPDEAESTRKPVMAFGLSSSEPKLSLASGSSDEFLMKSYKYSDDDGAAVVNRKTVESQAMAGGDVTSQDLVSCAICVPLVTQLCDYGTGTIGKYVCIEACLPFLAGSPLTYAACSASCILIVDALNNYGCAAGATAVCKAADLC